jgi:thiamine biosynthesis lipoprotein
MLAPIRFLVLAMLVLIVCRSMSIKLNEQKLYSLSGKAQGTTFLINYYADQEVVSTNSIYQILDAVDSSLSQYKPYSLISTFNKSAVGVKADNHLKKMISSSLHFSELTYGDFDITIKPISMLWGFNGLIPTTIPNKRTLKSALALVGSDHIRLVNDSLLKSSPGVMIDVDGIAQGYTVDLLADYLSSTGIKNFLVELGGEIITSGSKPDGSGWVIGVEGPVDEEQSASIVEKKLLISNKAITTSGSYRKFVKIKDQYFSHIINPKTGKPARNGVISVTVIADDATTADAFDNAFMVMGIDKTFALLKTMPELGVYMVYKKPDGRIADTSNTKFRQYISLAE